MKTLLSLALLTATLISSHAQSRVACVGGSRVWGDTTSWDTGELPSGANVAAIFGSELLVQDPVNEPALTLRIGIGSTVNVQADFKVGAIYLGRAGRGTLVQESGNVEADSVTVSVENEDSGECMYELLGGSLTVKEMNLGTGGLGVFRITGASEFKLGQRLILSPTGEFIISGSKSGFPKIQFAVGCQFNIKPESKLIVSCSSSLPAGRYVLIESTEKLAPGFKEILSFQGLPAKLQASVLQDEPGLVIQVAPKTN